jgi:hypothetical protein
MATQADTYNEGNVLVFTVSFTEKENGVLTDPTSVAFGYRTNGGAITTYVYGDSDHLITRVSIGTYKISVPTTGKPGTWLWEWQSTGVAQALTSGSLTIIAMPMSLIS